VLTLFLIPLSIARFGGLAGDPTYVGAYSLYWNPAALARPGWDVALDAQLLARQASYDRDADLNMVPDAERAANSGLARVSTVGVVPGVFGRWGRSVGAVDLGVGLGAFADAGGAASWDKNLNAPPQTPGAVDGPQRWAAIDSSLVVIDVAAGFAVRHRRSGLSFGATPMLAIAQFSTVRARNIDRSEDLVDAAGNPKEGRAYFAGSGLGWSLIAGVRWDIRPGWAVAASYQRGARLGLDGTLRVAFGTQPASSQRAHLELPIADTVRIGGALHVAPRLTLRPSLEWAIWSTLREHVFTSAVDGSPLLVMPRNFSDAIAGRVRADVTLAERWTLLVGLGAEKGPTPSSTMEPGFGEGNSLEAAVGARVQLSHRVTLSASFYFHYFFPWTVSDSIQQPPTNGTYRDQREYLVVDLEVHEWRPFGQ
jgi:long-chain fatty acid transport protein